MKPPKEPIEYEFIVEREKPSSQNTWSETCHVNFDVRLWANKPGTNNSPYDDSVNGVRWRDLIITTMITSSHESPTDGFSELEYRGAYVIDRQTAESMAHTLKTLERKIQALRDKLGPHKTFGQYVARVCACLGSPVVVSWKEEDGRERKLGSGDAVHYLDNMIAETWKECRKYVGKSYPGEDLCEKCNTHKREQASTLCEVCLQQQQAQQTESVAA